MREARGNWASADDVFAGASISASNATTASNRVPTPPVIRIDMRAC
jgi:hypothetical protein